MNRSYLIRCIPLFLFNPSLGIAADWEQAQNQGATFLAVQHNNNLFNTATDQISDQAVRAGIQWDWLELFEGFGVHLPIVLQRQQYNDAEGLDISLYQLQPQVRFFLSEQTDLAVKAVLQKDQILAGDAAAEFIAVSDQALVAKQSGVETVLSFGRAPDIQNLQLTLGTDRRQQQIQEQLFSRLDGDYAGAHYSHKLNESVALVAQLSRRQEQQNQLETDLNQYGAGVAVQWTGQQFFHFTAGRFSRSYADTNLNDTKGTFWQLNNLWQLDSRWQLELSSGRSSVLSYADQSVSQLDTQHQASLHWQYDQSHRLSLVAGRLTSALDQSDYRRDRRSFGGRWHWQWAQQWQSLLQLSQVRQQQNQQPERKRLELGAEVRWSW